MFRYESRMQQNYLVPQKLIQLDTRELHTLVEEVFDKFYAKSIEATKQKDKLFLSLATLLYN